jgi:HlyD family secretion protein
VAQSQANLVSMRDSLSKTVLRAPIDGRVTSLKAEKGETAIPGVSNLPGATLMVISDMSELMAEIKVNEGEVVRSKVGQTAQVTVESLPGRVFQGRVAEVATGNEGVGQDANMYKVKVALDMKSADVGRLRPGMSARAMILTSEARDVLRVPLQSVLEREGTAEEAQKQGLLAPAARSVVMVAKAGRATERAVTTGIANNQFFEVKAGLAEGEQVLTGPVRKLKDLKDRAAVKLKPKSDTQADEDAKKRKAGGKA